MNATAETKGFTCEFCHKTFAREQTIVSHICPGKKRWLDKDSQESRLAFQSWLQFHSKNSMGQKVRTFRDFITSPYYTAFVKYSAYCINVKAINIPRYTDWLLKEQVKIDTWWHDSVYTRYLIEYLRGEDPMDALIRSIETSQNMAAEAGILPADILRFGNPNKICYAVTTGRISPWMLYQSNSGVEFLSSLNGDQVRIVLDYIKPELWTLKFMKDKEMAKQVKDLLGAAGY
jgi:hypothetical protein